VGEVADYYRCAIGLVADRPGQPWCLRDHEGQEPLQVFPAVFGVSCGFQGWQVRCGLGIGCGDGVVGALICPALMLSCRNLGFVVTG
jgi:hypothetical protein